MMLGSLVVASCILTSTSAYTWPSPQYDALEKFLYEGVDINGAPVGTITRGCTKRGNIGPQNQSTVAAEWLRLAYHDMATHNVTDGTGGLDASIFFELSRPEDIGSGMSNSLNDFQLSASKYVSRADVIAMGAVWAVASCNGPSIPFRGGRRDAIGPGRLGVPEPQQDIASHTESFRLQGFTQTEMISLVACGHTLGGVRSADFPNIVVDKTGLNISTFDTTVSFDTAVVSEYLDSTTTNPLVRVANITLASDQRIFNSDGNVTIKGLNSQSAFFQTCTKLLARMLDTVPSNVTLTDEIELLQAKVSSARITVFKSQLLFDTTLRLSQPTTSNASTPTNRQVKLFWCDKRGQLKDCANTTNVASSPANPSVEVSPLTESQKTTFIAYQFSVPILANRSVSKFWFQVDEGDGSAPIIHDNAGHGYILPQDEIIYALSIGDRTADLQAGKLTQIFTLGAGIRSGSNLTRAQIHASDYSFRGSGTLVNTTVDLRRNTTQFLADGYDAYTARVETTGNALHMDLEVIIDGVSYVDDYISAENLIDQPGPLSSVTNMTTTSTSAAPGNTAHTASSALLIHPPPLVHLAILAILSSLLSLRSLL
ncbi:hypothetical protein GALMADRAFT_102888 [Galerina marginata CBS 339.88]|uniref:Peroxidase n=1 Tax=Galerina marginata (strain CBS 339.88) TaxID=685588 RepID=A0A067SL87_GALM3|nr:hypothetical protein GALMADRAFT_102888 [Galerina marginata CBS 339.88]